jgi:hypothetical protein
MRAGSIMAMAAAAAMPLAVDPPTIEEELAAIHAVARVHGDSLWPGFSAAPFGFLLVDGEREILLCHPTVPAGFASEGRDAATGCKRMVRPRSGLPDGLLAAMPLFGPPSTIVVGTPSATGLTPMRWRLTILHEHFHQWQTELPDYYARVAALDLSGGDETGMWMLDFPFPYDDRAAAQAFAEASQALARALAARGGQDFHEHVADYAARRQAFAAVAGERNWRYFEFQLWQEGVARWTEIAIGRSSNDKEMHAEAESREREVLEALAEPDLPRQQRLAAYPLGAGEAMLLEACEPTWRRRYADLLALGPLIEQAVRGCPNADSWEAST